MYGIEFIVGLYLGSSLKDFFVTRGSAVRIILDSFLDLICKRPYKKKQLVPEFLETIFDAKKTMENIDSNGDETNTDEDVLDEEIETTDSSNLDASETECSDMPELIEL